MLKKYATFYSVYTFKRALVLFYPSIVEYYPSKDVFSLLMIIKKHLYKKTSEKGNHTRPNTSNVPYNTKTSHSLRPLLYVT